MSLHILVDPADEHIVNVLHNPDNDKALRQFVRIHTLQEGRPLARIIVTGGRVKVIQAGEEEVATI